ncbi:MAG: helix-turn-helix domain-containing protein [Treponema sp.]|jgi:transposase|nr:helix-turn-helix domain-containing protein [Treponema sp.]
MEREFYLDDRDRSDLEKKTADKIKAILLMAQGFTCAEIERILLLDERTLNRYKRLYRNEGIDGLAANNYQGSSCKLSGEQTKELRRELDSKIYRTAEEICEYVWKRFKVRYTVKGMAQTLRRLGYSYKKSGRCTRESRQGEPGKVYKNL